MCVLVRSGQNPEPWRWSDGHWGFAGKPQVWSWSRGLSWYCTCATGCSTPWHYRGHRHYPSRTPSNIRTSRGPHCPGGDRWQKLAQAGKKASSSRARTSLQPPGQVGETGWQTVQPKGPEPLHTCRLETLFFLASHPFPLFPHLYRGQPWCLSVCLQVGQLNGFRNIFCGLVTWWRAWEEPTRFWRRSWTSCSNKEESSPECRTTLQALIYILFVNYTNKFFFFFNLCKVFYIYICFYQNLLSGIEEWRLRHMTYSVLLCVDRRPASSILY